MRWASSPACRWRARARPPACSGWKRCGGRPARPAAPETEWQPRSGRGAFAPLLAQLRHRLGPRLAQPLADIGTGQALGHRLAGGDGQHGLVQGEQAPALWIVVLLPAQAAAAVGLADQGQLADAFGLAEAVGARDQVMHSVRTQLVQAMHVEMLAAGDLGDGGVLGRYLQAGADGTQRPHAAVLMADVARQL